jgi:hypothetical protein
VAAGRLGELDYDAMGGPDWRRLPSVGGQALTVILPGSPRYSRSMSDLGWVTGTLVDLEAPERAVVGAG